MAVESDTPNDSSSPISVRCWGTRGSIPSPGPSTVRHGGNTTCVEVCGADLRIAFDAGSGIRPLGVDLVERGPNAVHIFLTHFHWDHIQGFPFFAPLYDPEDSIKVIGPKQKDIDVQNLFAGQMGPIYFPVPFSVVAADMEFEHLNDGGYEIGAFQMDVMRVRHPSFVLGIVDFVGDADLLIHDSMYTEEEYPHRVGWGHSTYEQTLRLAQEGGVKKLLFFHHDPNRSDYELDAIVAMMRERASAGSGSLRVEMAKEGVDYWMGRDS
jgi:phosphoribosyl 1,2-cyclic phosphodiesterase